MAETQAPPFSVIGQFLKDLSFENVLFSQMKQLDVKGNPKIDITPKVLVRTLDEKERVFEYLSS